MPGSGIGKVGLSARIETWPLARPFAISGHVFRTIDTLIVRLEADGACGTGEAAGVYYFNDTAPRMLERLASVREEFEEDPRSEKLQRLLPPGGLRNAIDCALWDLSAKLERKSAWQLAGLDRPRALITTFTCGVDTPEAMARQAQAYAGARAIKLKLDGDLADAARVRAVRAARPDVWLGVDTNQGFTREAHDRLLPVLKEAGVALLEQPFPVGKEAWLDGMARPIPIAADESVQCADDLEALVGRFDVVNIKLDKCGGLTEGLRMARLARQLGLAPMVGNMSGTSLAMAPAFLLGQLCDVVDLDGPMILARDRPVAASYRDGKIDCPALLWGYPQSH